MDLSIFYLFFVIVVFFYLGLIIGTFYFVLCCVFD